MCGRGSVGTVVGFAYTSRAYSVSQARARGVHNLLRGHIVADLLQSLVDVVPGLHLTQLFILFTSVVVVMLRYGKHDTTSI